jgi:hypothetical protein
MRKLYTRRAWYFQYTVNSKGYDCVTAVSDLGYDIYLGADTVDDYTNSLNYLQNEANKAGWNLAPCGIKFSSICEAPSTSFPCYPPPSPPSPPPLPPSPPSPPMPPTCGPRHWQAPEAAGTSPPTRALPLPGAGPPRRCSCRWRRK